MSVGINELYDMLDSDDEEIQQRGIKEGAKVKYLPSSFYQARVKAFG